MMLVSNYAKPRHRHLLCKNRLEYRCCVKNKESPCEEREDLFFEDVVALGPSAFDITALNAEV